MRVPKTENTRSIRNRTFLLKKTKLNLGTLFLAKASGVFTVKRATGASCSRLRTSRPLPSHPECDLPRKLLLLFLAFVSWRVTAVGDPFQTIGPKPMLQNSRSSVKNVLDPIKSSPSLAIFVQHGYILPFRISTCVFFILLFLRES